MTEPTETRLLDDIARELFRQEDKHDDWRRRLSEAKLGTKHTHEHNQKIKQNARRTDRDGQRLFLVSPDGTERVYASAYQAAKALGVSRQTIYISIREGYKVLGMTPEWRKA